MNHDAAAFQVSKIVENVADNADVLAEAVFIVRIAAVRMVKTHMEAESHLYRGVIRAHIRQYIPPSIIIQLYFR